MFETIPKTHYINQWGQIVPLNSPPPLPYPKSPQSRNPVPNPRPQPPIWPLRPRPFSPHPARRQKRVSRKRPVLPNFSLQPRRKKRPIRLSPAGTGTPSAAAPKDHPRRAKPAASITSATAPSAAATIANSSRRNSSTGTTRTTSPSITRSECARSTAMPTPWDSSPGATLICVLPWPASSSVPTTSKVPPTPSFAPSARTPRVTTAGEWIDPPARVLIVSSGGRFVEPQSVAQALDSAKTIDLPPAPAAPALASNLPDNENKVENGATP